MVIRKVLFDAFGTIFSPRKPIHIQYAEVARSFGLQVNDLAVQRGFLITFKKISAIHPLYGKLTGISKVEDWWKLVILDTFLEAGVSSADLQPIEIPLSNTLITRFWSREGYALHSSILPTLSFLSHRRQLHPQLEVLPSGIVSGSDRGAIKVLIDLGVINGGSGIGILEKNVLTTWDLESDKKSNLFWEKVLDRINEEAEGLGLRTFKAEEILVVGDELIPDYIIPRSAGFQSLLLRRNSVEGGNEKGLEDVECIGELDEIIEWIGKYDKKYGLTRR